jgi:hypothetical protein
MVDWCSLEMTLKEGKADDDLPELFDSDLTTGNEILNVEPEIDVVSDPFQICQSGLPDKNWADMIKSIKARKP